MDILVVDIGGTHIKLYSRGGESAKFDSGPDFTPDRLISEAMKLTADWQFDAVSIGYPGRVGHDGPVAEPGNLGNGWVRFDYDKAFGKPVRIVNDAAMQALGAYDGKRMLFLGLGTGLGSALIADRSVVSLELGGLPYCGEQMWQRVGVAGLERYGEAVWEQSVHEIVFHLSNAFAADYVVLGGGNVERLKRLPEHARRGGNDDAFTGGVRLWEEEVEHHDRPPSNVWRVVR